MKMFHQTRRRHGPNFQGVHGVVFLDLIWIIMVGLIGHIYFNTEVN